MDLDALKQDVIRNAETTIETCRLIETRMVDQYVLALPDGSVLHTVGIRPFGKSLGDVQRTRDRAKIEALLDHVRTENPDNTAVQDLKIMGWKKAARLQRETYTSMIEFMSKA